MQHLGCGAYQVCSNDDLRLTLTYLMSRSNLHPNAFKWENFYKVDFFENFGNLSYYSLLICLYNETMAINKFQRSRLTFDLSA